MLCCAGIAPAPSEQALALLVTAVFPAASGAAAQQLLASLQAQPGSVLGSVIAAHGPVQISGLTLA